MRESAGARHEVSLPVRSDDLFVLWQFEVESFDVWFSVEFHVDLQWAATQPTRQVESVVTLHERTLYPASTASSQSSQGTQRVSFLPRSDVEQGELTFCFLTS